MSIQDHMTRGVTNTFRRALVTMLVEAGWDRDRATAKANNLIMIRDELRATGEDRFAVVREILRSISAPHDGGPGGARLAGQIAEVLGWR